MHAECMSLHLRHMLLSDALRVHGWHGLHLWCILAAGLFECVLTRGAAAGGTAATAALPDCSTRARPSKAATILQVLHADAKLQAREHQLLLRRQLGPVVRSPEAATAGGAGHGLSVSLLERFIQRNQEAAGGLMAEGLAPATGRPPFMFHKTAPFKIAILAG